jgi:hypothetical protein
VKAHLLEASLNHWLGAAPADVAPAEVGPAQVGDPAGSAEGEGACSTPVS